uniref:Transporter n=1 Tax=Mastacembelus armatus TaxID=205130 RepID=A0A7N8XFR8_9TELE
MADQLPPQQGDPLLDKCHQGSLPSRKEAAKNSLQTRGQWGSKAEFLLAVAGQIIGLGNVWRFPYLCYKNGGGVFFVPYLLFLVLCGIPLFLLETSLGQYTSLGGVSAWRTICPLFGGLGYASQVIILHGCVYYIIILAWALFYLSYSFQAELPWSHCNNTWNTGQLRQEIRSFSQCNKRLLCQTLSLLSVYCPAETCVQFEHHNQTTHVSSLPENATSPVMEFWEREALRLSSSLDELGPISWKLALCLAIVWLTCYFCVWKGVKSTGKVVYLTATFPYVMLFVLLVRGVTLPGAAQGIIYYLKPNHTRLADPQVWMDAGTQIFFSYGICLGSLTALGSYNKYNNDCYKDSFFLCLLNSSTSFLAGFAIFSVLGFMAEEQGVDISTVAQSGPGLAFIAYPRAVAMMPLPQLWAVCFFLMIIMLGLDTQFVSLEALMTSITDLYPHLIRRGHRRELLLLFICIVCFLIGLVMVTPKIHFKSKLATPTKSNNPAISQTKTQPLMGPVLATGAERFSANIRDMTGYSPMPAFKLCWKYLTPAVCTVSDHSPFLCFHMLVYCLTLKSQTCLPVYYFTINKFQFLKNISPNSGTDIFSFIGKDMG